MKLEKDSEFEGLLSNVCDASFYCGEHGHHLWNTAGDYTLKMDSLRRAQEAIRVYHRKLISIMDSALEPNTDRM
jgi:hypothetical protein